MRRILPTGLALLALLLTVTAVTYLVVACGSLPSFMGRVAGDPHPRTKLGLAVAVLAAGSWMGTVLAARRRPE